MTAAWGPLAALIGEWEGDGGLDAAFSHARGQVIDTPYREKVSMKPFGPFDNGNQHLGHRRGRRDDLQVGGPPRLSDVRHHREPLSLGRGQHH